jgi:polysaccharide biosynthesis/export protein
MLLVRMKSIVWCYAALILFLGSCSINKNLMFKTDDEFVFDEINFDSTNVEYRISPNDLLIIEVFTNEGAIILEFTTSATSRPQNLAKPEVIYTVNKDGFAELPGIGLQKLEGLTIMEAQDFLEEKFGLLFNRPFCQVKVVNRRAMVFPGTGGEGIVIPLVNPNISIIEALALAGGISERGDASKVKLVRGRTVEEQKVFLIDLSTIEGIKYANMAVQAGDIIYVEPTPQIPLEVLKDAQPFFQFFTGLGFAYFVIFR